jgi:hypothetical protein
MIVVVVVKSSAPTTTNNIMVVCLDEEGQGFCSHIVDFTDQPAKRVLRKQPQHGDDTGYCHNYFRLSLLWIILLIYVLLLRVNSPKKV